MQIQAGARAALQRQLSRYFWGTGSDIKIVVKRGQVASKTDSDIAFSQCNSVPSAFKAFNLLRVQSSTKKARAVPIGQHRPRLKGGHVKESDQYRKTAGVLNPGDVGTAGGLFAKI